MSYYTYLVDDNESTDQLFNSDIDSIKTFSFVMDQLFNPETFNLEQAMRQVENQIG